METASEPYERLRCNELRRECYRRKLPVVKQGPLANATKQGYIQLLRQNDRKRERALQVQQLTVEERGAAVTVNRNVPQRQQAVASLGNGPGCEPGVTRSGCQDPRRRVSSVIMPRPVSFVENESDTDESMSSTSFSAPNEAGITSSAPEDQYLYRSGRCSEPQAVGSTFYPDFSAIKSLSEGESLHAAYAQSSGSHRWECMHRRLNLVDEKLESLLRKQQHHSPPLDPGELIKDIEVYKHIKHRLRQDLLFYVDRF